MILGIMSLSRNQGNILVKPIIGIDDALILGGIGLASGAATGGMNMLGSMMGNRASAKAQSSQQYYNSKEAEKNRAWMEHMSNTAYQRAKADLLAAGYNPILAFSHGPASTPSSGAPSSGAYQGQAPQLGQSIVSGVGAVNSALNAVKTFNDADLSDARKGLLESSKEVTDLQSQYHLSANNVSMIDNHARVEAMTGVESKEVGDLLDSFGVPYDRYNALVDMYKEQIRVGKYMPTLNAIGQTVDIIGDAASAYQRFRGAAGPKK